MITRDELRAGGWRQDADGLWRRRDGRVHEHSTACTRESCGEGLFFCAGEVCLRAGARTGERRSCDGHPLLSRADLVPTTRRRRSRAVADDRERTKNTWSDEP